MTKSPFLALPATAGIVEERYIQPVFCARLRNICSTRATVVHVDVAQQFVALLRRHRPDDNAAQRDAEAVFQLLNDDMKGNGAFQNTAAGYRLYNAGRLFMLIAALPADLLDVPASAPVDMAERFDPRFVDGQLALPDRPIITGNRILDMQADLRYIQSVAIAITEFLAFQVESNARSIYTYCIYRRNLRGGIHLRVR